MLSRVAESIYWMSRYVERAENVARFISVNLNLSMDLASEGHQQWLPLVTTTGDDKLFYEHYDAPTKRNVLQFLTFDRNNPNSILSSLIGARECARSIREVISAEMWEHINNFYLMVKDVGGADGVSEEQLVFYEQIRASGQHFIGITDATMTHGEGWHFGQCGRFMERADKTSRILDVKYYILLPSPQHVGSPFDELQWSALLRSASAFEMYRQRYGRIIPANIVSFLVLDRAFPRAILHCLSKANDSLHAISGSDPESFSNLPEQRLGQLRASLAFTSADDIINRGMHEFVDDMQRRVNAVGLALSNTFFARQTDAA
ncbi:alpha-E domain-containing protein [Blastopirellula sp. J2-11]|uniref:alpha-E domain-containing protein n=1 Tax=Blastopirellula sp. J2-11 TaxID=2943192 RepID=UPI0021C592FB|nr:alpha-E domain-containing protein [Blastopirellula sp. J2-11]UUO08320.1 alpha-E domain-containing protein [Blastopirellula sp. J2-11]